MFTGHHTTGKRYKDIDKSVTAQGTAKLWYNDSSVLPPRKTEFEMKVRVLNNDYICVVINPNKFLKERDIAHGYAKMKSIEEGWPATWAYPFSFWQRRLLTMNHYIPQIIKDTREPSHWKVNGVVPTVYGMWHHRVDSLNYNITEYDIGTRHANYANWDQHRGDSTTTTVDPIGEYGIFCYIKMPTTMVDGNVYNVIDTYGNRVEFTYTDLGSHSWAIKVNQLGYLTGTAKKYAYLGMWMGPDLVGLDFSSYSGNTFHLRKVSDNSSVYNSTIAFRMDDPVRIMETGPYGEGSDPTPATLQNMTGEYKQYEMDFSTYTTAGEYYIQVDGIGKSWPFEIGANAMAPLFYHTSRALYHQRASHDFNSNTNFPHSTKYLSFKEGGFGVEDPISYHYASGCPDGEYEFLCGMRWGGEGTSWGWYDVTDGLWFQEGWSLGGSPNGIKLHNAYVLDWATVPEMDSSVKGGWHDAADIDSRPLHIDCAIYPTIAYLMNPTRFTDNQLDLPESGDLTPDILSNAMWGLEWCRIIQGLKGTGGTVLTAEGPWHNARQYATGEPTRVCTYYYAFCAALMGKALLVAGRTTEANVWITSAEDAYNWANTVGQQTFANSGGTYGGHTIRYKEPPTTHESYIRAKLWAAIGLRIATEEATYLTALNTIGTTFFTDYLVKGTSGWENENLEKGGSTGRAQYTVWCSIVSLYSSLMPTNWGSLVNTSVAIVADQYIDDWIPSNMYRETYLDGGMTWNGSSWDWGSSWWQNANFGVRGTQNTAIQFVAYKLIGAQKYLDAATGGMDYYLGCNPQGRTSFSGIGSSSLYRWLYIAGNEQMRGEWTRGYDIFDNNFLLSTTYYGISDSYATSSFRTGRRTRQDWGDSEPFREQWLIPKPYENVTEYISTEIDTYFPYINTLYGAWNDYSKMKRLFEHMIPFYRRRSHTHGYEVNQNEYTIYQNQAPSIFVAACAMSTGWSPDINKETNWAARTEDEMFDSKYFMP